MRSKLLTICLLTAATVIAAPEAVRQFQSLKNTTGALAERGLRSGFATVYASEGFAAERRALHSDAEGSDQFRWAGQVAPGKAIEIKGVNGAVHAEAGTGNQVEVIAEKRGRRSDPKDVNIQVVEHPEGVTICAVYPSDDPARPNTCQPGPASHMSVRNNDVQVEFTVRVPAGVRFIGRTVNGGVEANGIGGNVEAHTVNGSVQVSASGIAEAETVNGGITASLGSAAWTSPLKFKTVNGGITVNLPSDTSAEVQADTVNGEITSDFPLTVQGRFSRKHMTGTIGGGGRELVLKTVNGSIHLRRSS